MECTGYRPLCPVRCHEGFGRTCISEWAEKQAQWPVPSTLHCVMVFMNLHNGHVDLHNGHVSLHNSHLAQVRSVTAKKTLHCAL
jgi:hypothetical protein